MLSKGKVAVGDDRDEGALGALGAPARLEQPFGEVAALPELGDGELYGPGASVPGARPVAVSGVDPVGVLLAVGGVADSVGLGAMSAVTKALTISRSRSTSASSSCLRSQLMSMLVVTIVFLLVGLSGLFEDDAMVS